MTEEKKRKWKKATMEGATKENVAHEVESDRKHNYVGARRLRQSMYGKE